MRRSPSSTGRFDLEAFTTHVRQVMVHRGHNQADLAAAINVAPSTITRLFQGNQPALDVAASLALWADLDLNSYVLPRRDP